MIGLGGRPAVLAIEPLIDIVREIDHAVADGERAAAILVSAGANAESVGVVGCHAFRLPVRADAIDEGSVPAFAAEFHSNRLRRRRARPARDGSQARRILLSVPRVGDSEFVFPGAKTGTSFNDWARLKAEIDEAIGEPALMQWVIHDLRRSLIVTILAGRPYSLSPSILDKLLGHAPTTLKGAAKIYQRQEYPEERREALETWARVLTGKTAKAAR